MKSVVNSHHSLRYNPILEKWVCTNCGAKYGSKWDKPLPTYCMKCKVEWEEENDTNESN